MKTQAEKGHAFRALHQREGAFIIPNPWDPGTAHLLAHLGFEALATTSAGYAFSVGQRDNTIPRDQMLAHASALVAAIDLPVSADLESGYGDTLDEVAETYRLAAATGLVGASIEDATGDARDPIHAEAVAVERVRVAAEVVHALPFPFMLTARAENYLVGRPDIRDTIRRLQAYQEACADVLYAPGLTRREDIAAVVSSIDRPLNVLVGISGCRLDLAELSVLGANRVSVGSALFRAALTSFLRAGREMVTDGTFNFADDAMSYSEMSAMFRAGPSPA